MSVYTQAATLDGSSPRLATGRMEMVLDQAEIAKAVEFWLNSLILKAPCEVSRLHSAVVNQRATFTVTLQEATMGEGEDG